MQRRRVESLEVRLTAKQRTEVVNDICSVRALNNWNISRQAFAARIVCLLNISLH